MKHLFIAILSIVCFCACKQNKNKQSTIDAPAAVGTTFKINTALDVEPELQTTDSLEILYYNNPDGDPKRYTRFFKFVAISDTTIITALTKNLNTAITGTALKDCRSQGKIYFRKHDAIINTVYFSYRSEKCSYLYFIKNGNYYYVSINKNVISALKNAKSKAKEPIAK